MRTVNNHIEPFRAEFMTTYLPLSVVVVVVVVVAVVVVATAADSDKTETAHSTISQ